MDKTNISEDYQHRDTIEKSLEFLNSGEDGTTTLSLEDELRLYAPR